jgi:predicted  nucleic acid-binding Zn-ribbon protein
MTADVVPGGLPRVAPPASHGAIVEATSALLRSTAETEADFLWLGDCLQRVTPLSRQITRQASDAAHAAESVGGEGGAAALQEASSAITVGLRAWQREVSDVLASLDVTYAALDSTAELPQFLTTLARRLRVVGLYTLIEVRRLPDVGTDLDSFCAVVQQLSERVQGLTKAFRAEASGVTREGLRARDAIHACAEALNAEVLVAEDALVRSTEAVGAMLAAGQRCADLLDDSSRQISQHVGRVVSCLQFHDTARQRIEHVCEALEPVGQPNDDGGDASGADTTRMGRVLALQVAQLSGVATSAEETQCTLTSAFDVIREHARAQAVHFTEAVGCGTGGALQDAHDSLAAVDDALAVSLEYGGSIVAEVARIAGFADQMSTWARDFGALSGEIQLLGLNAVIMTARLGGDGAALTVCAGEICRIANGARSVISGISDELAAAGRDATRLRDELGASAAEHAEELRQLKETIDRTVDELPAMQARMLEVARATTALATDLAAEVDAATTRIQLTRTVVPVVRAAAERLSEIRHTIVGDDAEGDDEVLASLAARYTMSSERLVHEAVAGAGETAGPIDDSGDVELFGDLPPCGGSSEGVSGEVELFGDVELF